MSPPKINVKFHDGKLAKIQWVKGSLKDDKGGAVEALCWPEDRRTKVRWYPSNPRRSAAALYHELLHHALTPVAPYRRATAQDLEEVTALTLELNSLKLWVDNPEVILWILAASGVPWTRLAEAIERLRPGGPEEDKTNG